MKKYLFSAIFFLPLLALASPVSAMTCEYRVEKAVQYGSGPMSLDYVEFTEQTTEQKLYLDAYIPTVCDGKPVTEGLAPIEWVHGGGFGAGKRDEPGIVKIASELAKNGFAVFSIDYRLVPNQKKKNTMPILETLTDTEREAALEKARDGQTLTDPDDVQNLYGAFISVEDSIKARAWIDANAERFQIDSSRWGVMGSSAGAATVLSLAYISDDLGFQPQGIAAVVDMVGATQPLSLMEAGEPPLLIIHGTADATVPYARSEELVNRAEEVGIPVERITLTGAGHGIGGVNIMRNNIEGTNDLIITRVISFFDQNLRCEPSADTTCLQVRESEPGPFYGDVKVPVRPSLWDRIWNFFTRLF